MGVYCGRHIKVADILLLIIPQDERWLLSYAVMVQVSLRSESVSIKQNCTEGESA